ncbi:MAG: hypothetical protein GY801_14410, partial [bacterium]|nr:hypothetical protein [bacterium]
MNNFFPRSFLFLFLMSQEQRFLSHKRFRVIYTFWFKFTFISTVFIIVAVLANWWVLHDTSRKLLTSELEQKGHIIAKFVRSFNVRTSYQEGLQSKNYQKLQSMLELAKSLDQELLYIFATDDNGQVIAQSPAEFVDGATVGKQRLEFGNRIPEGNALAHQLMKITQADSTTHNVMDTAITIVQHAELHVGIRNMAQNSSISEIGKLIGIIVV